MVILGIGAWGKGMKGRGQSRHVHVCTHNDNWTGEHENKFIVTIGDSHHRLLSGPWMTNQNHQITPALLWNSLKLFQNALSAIPHSVYSAQSCQQ